jgi:hypothetical protein
LVVFFIEDEGVEGFRLFGVVVDARGEVCCGETVLGLQVRAEGA